MTAPGLVGRRARLLLVAAVLAMCLAGSVSIRASAQTLQAAAPVARSDVLTRPRFAVIVAPQPAESSSRAATAQADAEALSRRLREIGFEVRTVGPAGRPELARSLRDVAGQVPTGAEVVVLVLGQTFGGADDVFLLPAGTPYDLAARPASLETEAIRLGDILRRLAERRPAELVVVADECRPVVGAHCPLDAAVASSDASIVAAERTDPLGGGTPVAAQASLREPLLRAMVTEGQSFLALYEALRSGLARTDLAALASSRLSSSFQFLPSGFFRGLRTECNRVDPALDAASVRNLPLDPLVRACQAALATYPSSEFFRSQLGAAQEQQAFQRGASGCDRLAAAGYRSAYPAGRFRAVVDEVAAGCERQDEQRRQDEARRREQEEEAAYRRAVVSCADRREAAGYVGRYSAGRYRSAVDSFVRDCEAADRQREAEARQREQQQRQEAALREAEEQRQRDEAQRRRDQERQSQAARALMGSRTGWTASYAISLLHIEPGDADKFTPDGLVTTFLKPNSLYDGKVDFFIQTGENKQCQAANEWTDRVLSRNRPRYERRGSIPITGQLGFFQKGPAFKGDPGVSFIDVVLIPREDPNMFVHLGVQYPAADEDKWRDEFFRVVASFRLTSSGLIRGSCR